MNKIKKELIKQAILKGLLYGFFYSLIPTLATTGSLDNLLELLLLGIGVACFLTFYMTYRVNWLLYLKFKDKYGVDFINLANAKFNKSGIREMLKEDWFAEVARQDYRGKFQRRL